MSFSIPKFPTFSSISPNTTRIPSNFPQLSVGFTQFSTGNANFGCRYGLLRCYAAAKQQKSGGAPPATTTKKKRKPKKLVGDDFEIEKSGEGVEVMESASESAQSPYSSLPLPNPPAGFVLDEQGRVLMASNKRIATIVIFYFCF